MPIPQPVLDILNSFSIVTPAAGSQVPVGVPLTPTLNTNPLTAFNSLVLPEVIASLDLDVNLNQIRLELGPASAGDTNLDIVLKAVEFPTPVEILAQNVPVTAQASGKLPYTIPVSGPGATITSAIGSQVQGLLGTAEGKIKQVERIIGSIAGKITGQVTRTLLAAAPPVTINWRIQDGAGQDLTATQVVNLGSTAAPVFVLLPDFVEFTGGPSTTSERRLSVTITVTIGAESVSRLLGPVSIQIPQVQIPTVLVFTEHAVGDPSAPGSIFLAVPKNSAIDANTDIDGILAPLGTLFGTIVGALPAAHSAAVGFVAAGTAIGRLRGLLSRNFFVKDDSTGNLWFAPWSSFNDLASSLVMTGPPGKRLRLYNATQDIWTGAFVERKGSINVTLGPTGTADIPNFTTGMPPAGAPSGAGSFDTSIILGMVGTPALSDFNDVLSAYKFLAPLEP